jgi:PAS domain S-box-containing protein
VSLCDAAIGKTSRQKKSELHLRKTEQPLQETRQGLLESEDRFRLLVESVTDYAIYMLDPEGLIVTWNAGAERLKGYKAEEVLGQNYSIFSQPEDAEAGVPARELVVAAREGRYEIETWRRRKDGTRFWAMVTLSAIRGRGGELRGFASVVRDMTAKKDDEALQSLNALLEHYRIIVENVTDYAIFTLDAEGRIDNWSSGARNVLGYTDEEALGREYSMVFAPAGLQADELRRELEEAKRNGHCATESWRVRRDGSIFWSSGVLTAVRDEAGKLTGYICVARDRTRQKRLEDSLERLASDQEDRISERTLQLKAKVEELRRKSEEVEAFAQSASRELKEKEVLLREIHHRVKNNLQVIQSLLRMGIRSFPPGEARTATEKMIERVHAMAMVHERLHKMPDLAGMSLASYVRDIFAGVMASNAVRPGQIKLRLDTEDILLTIDRAIPFGLLANELLSNCLKHGFPGGRKGTITVSIHRIPGAVRMIVKDDGIGLPEHFDAGVCNSMGLKLTASLAHQLGGSLRFTSDKGCQVQGDLTRL